MSLLRANAIGSKCGCNNAKSSGESAARSPFRDGDDLRVVETAAIALCRGRRARAHQGLSNARARRSLRAVNGALKLLICTERYCASTVAPQRLRVEDRERNGILEQTSRLEPSLYGQKAAPYMPVITANGVKAKVVLIVEDEFSCDMELPMPCGKRAMPSSSAGAANRLSLYADRKHRLTCCSPTSISAARSVAGRSPNAFVWSGRMVQSSTRRAMRSIRTAVVPTVCLSPSRIYTTTS
jgi:hypothetical protein